MGVGDLFNSSADLSVLTGGSEIQLDDAVHKAKIQVDEEGTTAAAATAFFTFRSSRPLDAAMFICNHPFVYLLYDASSQTILFAGIFKSPPPSGWALSMDSCVMSWKTLVRNKDSEQHYLLMS